MELVEGKYLEYKDRPLVREGNTICYGDKTEKCFLLLEIMSYKKDEQSGEELPDKIFIQIIDSKDPNETEGECVVKTVFVALLNDLVGIL